MKVETAIIGVICNGFWEAMECDSAACIAGWVVQDINRADEDGIALHLDSEGGSVIAAQRIASALRQWREKYPAAPLLVQVESLAASAAANLLTQIPRDKATRITCRRDSQLMFHSSAALVFGGADAMRDTAKSIDDYNSAVKAWLEEHTSLTPEWIADAFAEGREGWLSADEAVAAGLVDEITDDAAAAEDAEVVKQVAKYAKGIRQRLAKRMSKRIAKSNKEKPMEEDEKKPTPAEKETAPAAECGAGKEPEKTAGETAPAPAPAEEKKPEETAPADDLQKKVEELASRISALEEELKQKEEVVAKLTAGLRSPEKPQKQAQTFAEAVREISARTKTQAEYDREILKWKDEHPNAPLR